MATTANQNNRVHAFGDDALGEHDAIGLADALRDGRVGRTEVVEAAIARAEQVDPALGAIAHEAYDRGRAAARGEAGDGYFAGVPTFVKDNSDVAGLPTQQGTDVYTARPAVEDGDFAKTFFRLGVVNLGKTELSEFGFSPSAEGPGHTVRNPWDPAYSTGASSAGAAALVAAGVVPMAHANDGGGSIRIPAACCGVVGLKPSRGRVPQDKTASHLPVRVVADGVVTRSVRDTAAYLRETERIAPARGLRPIGDVGGPGRESRRIALVVDSLLAATDAETAAAVRDTGALLESMGHHVEEIAVPVPTSFVEDFKVYYGSLFLAINASGKQLMGPDFDWRKTEPLTRGIAGYAGKRLHRLPVAISRLRASQRRSRQLYRDYDALITPTLSQLTPRIGHLDPMLPFDVVMPRVLDWVGFTPLQNATGDPAISLPYGVNSNGTPLAVQLAAGMGNEATLLELAYAFEEARPFPRIHG